MKCSVTSDTTHGVLISKDIIFKSYKEICSGEKKKVNLGFNFGFSSFKVINNSLVNIPREVADHVHDDYGFMPYNWEILSMFFSFHNIEPSWLDCNYTYGWYDEELGGWTGCVGKV